MTCHDAHPQTRQHERRIHGWPLNCILKMQHTHLHQRSCLTSADATAVHGRVSTCYSEIMFKQTRPYGCGWDMRKGKIFMRLAFFIGKNLNSGNYFFIHGTWAGAFRCLFHFLKSGKLLLATENFLQWFPELASLFEYENLLFFFLELCSTT